MEFIRHTNQYPVRLRASARQLVASSRPLSVARTLGVLARLLR